MEGDWMRNILEDFGQAILCVVAGSAVIAMALRMLDFVSSI